MKFNINFDSEFTPFQQRVIALIAIYFIPDNYVGIHPFAKTAECPIGSFHVSVSLDLKILSDSLRSKIVEMEMDPTMEDFVNHTYQVRDAKEAALTKQDYNSATAHRAIEAENIETLIRKLDLWDSYETARQERLQKSSS